VRNFDLIKSSQNNADTEEEDVYDEYDVDETDEFDLGTQ
jgi:hypothetical protein